MPQCFMHKWIRIGKDWKGRNLRLKEMDWIWIIGIMDLEWINWKEDALDSELGMEIGTNTD